ncbi:hypothetical protein TNCV_1078131 [Trichonephila clavipes]|nr:hypothetical protein TNCV_1078131 [Trichonephila clavipes]
MDEQLKALLEGINALKNGQEDTRQEMQKGLEDMQKIQEETKNELKDRMEKGQEETKKEMQNCQEDLKNTLEKKIDNVEEKINKKKVGEEIERIKEQVEEKIKEHVEERIEGVAENFSLISQRMGDLEKKLLARGNENKNKFVPVSAFPEHMLASPVAVTAFTGPSETVNL